MEQKLTYEQAMKELEQTVALLENSDTDMDKAFELYEKGVKLAKFCEEYLSEKEKSLKEEA
ncbi:MAG: exodeoxyribonuclease VII small subunit [Clostridia bacterium]|nr:exodeoxyribonuclease VII small subunit [Clostridia bacterium]